MYFLTYTFFEKFCFLPTYMFGFNELDLKWMFMIPPIHFSHKKKLKRKKRPLEGETFARIFL